LTTTTFAAATAQTSPGSSRASASPAASEAAPADLTPDQVIRLLVDRLNEERQIHEATKKERDEAVAALEIEKQNSASIARSYKIAEDQIARMDRALQHSERAIALYEKTIAMVEKQRDDAKKEAKRSRRIAVISTAVTIAQIAAKILF
jgi:hypothetical protein